MESHFTAGFIGFGLIAGSMAKAMKKNCSCTILATSRHLEPLYRAQKDGVLDYVLNDIYDKQEPSHADFSTCDIIFISTPVVTICSYLEKLKDIVKQTCIITDVGSVKNSIYKTAIDCGLSSNYIGGHPMAGSETSGYDNSDEKIIKDACYVIVPTKDSNQEQIDFYKNLMLEIGFRVEIMDSETHDKAVAGISHATHLISATLAKTVAESDIEPAMRSLISTGFIDTTRIAASSPEMWSQICLSNSDAIVDFLDDYLEKLKAVRDSVSQATISPESTSKAIEDLFTQAGEYRSKILK